jgi:hypothetical protein
MKKGKAILKRTTPGIPTWSLEPSRATGTNAEIPRVHELGHAANAALERGDARAAMAGLVKSAKKVKNNTRDSNVVPHRSTNRARRCLTSNIKDT